MCTCNVRVYMYTCDTHNRAIVRLTERVSRDFFPLTRSLEWPTIGLRQDRSKRVPSRRLSESADALEEPFCFSARNLPQSDTSIFYLYSAQLFESPSQSCVWRHPVIPGRSLPDRARFLQEKPLGEKCLRASTGSSVGFLGSGIRACTFQSVFVAPRRRLNLLQVLHSAIISERFLDPKCGQPGGGIVIPTFLHHLWHYL